MCDGAAVSVFRRSVVAAVAFHVVVTPASATPGAESGANNSILIIDSSNSMWSQISGRGRYDIARRVLSKDFASYSGRFDLGIIAYGHRSKKSCSDIQTVMPIGEIKARQYSRAIRRFTPKGKTPISRALKAAMKETKSGSPPDNIILLSDGIDNCGPNPCATAAALKSTHADLKVHVIALSVPLKRQNNLSCIAKNTEGTFIAARNEAGLATATKAIFELVAKRNEEIQASQELVAQGATGDTDLPGARVPSALLADTLDLVGGSNQSGTSDRGIPVPKASPKAATSSDTSSTQVAQELIGEPQAFSPGPARSPSGAPLGTGSSQEIVTLPGITATPEMLISPEIVSATEVMAAPKTVAAPDYSLTPDKTKSPEFTTGQESASLAVTAVRDRAANPRIIAVPQISAVPDVAKTTEIAAKPEVAEVHQIPLVPQAASVPQVTTPLEIISIPMPRLDAVADATTQNRIAAASKAVSTSDRMDTESGAVAAAPAIADGAGSQKSSNTIVADEVLAALDIPVSQEPPPPPSPPAPFGAGIAPAKPATTTRKLAVVPFTTGALSSDEPFSEKPPVKINIGDRPIPKLPDEVRPTFLINEEPVDAGEEGLILRGQISSATATITRPIDWAAYKVEEAKTDRWRKIASVAMAEASISLPPGQYVVRASYGAARAAKVLEVKPGKRIDATFILNAGGLRILPGLAFLDTPKDIFAKHWVFGASPNEKGKRRLFAQSTAIGEVVRLNAGTYTLVSRFGNANAVVETNITIRPGTLTEVEINHKVGIVSFQISNPPKNPAGDDAVKWQLVDDSGSIIVRADGPEMTQILAPGSYRVMVEHHGKSYTSEFVVEIGETKAVEIATR